MTLVPFGVPFVCGQLDRFRSLISLKYGEIMLERVSKIPPKRDPETGKIEERVVDGE
jgi:hypothetical protein